ncbi:MAG: MFS transporter [Alphaproteobacteria bacterium]
MHLWLMLQISKSSRAQIAVATLFVTNGMIFGNVLPRIPVFKDQLGLSEAELGLALLCIAFGSISMFFFAAKIIRRYTSTFVSTLSAIFFLVAIVPIALSWNLYSFAFLLLFLGWANGLMDIAMNMQVIEVEKLRNQALMSKMHGLWSVGSLLGGLMCWGFSYFQVGLLPHFAIVSALSVAAVVMTRNWLVKTEPQLLPPTSKRGWVMPSTYLLVLGVIGLCAAMAEAVSMEWSALFLRERLPDGSALSVMGFIAFTSMMVVGRFAGDGIIKTYPTKPLLFVCASSVIAGYGFMLTMDTAWAAFVGYAFAGLGISIIAPLVYGIGARDTTRPPGVGLALVTAIGYGGFVMGAPLIGFIAEASSLRFALCSIVVLMVLLLILTTQVRAQAPQTSAANND